jgi:hypothetical protein
LRLPLFLCVLLLSGCASVADCNDPYQTGVRDGVLNANQLTTLGSRCNGFSEARYLEGFAEGFARRGRVFAL